MRKRLRQLTRRLQCRRSGHVGACTTEVFREAGLLMEHHFHVCLRCGFVQKDETAPLTDPDLLGLLADFGIQVEPPRPAYIN